MKKINSIGYGGKIISVGILCAFIIPIIIFFFPYKCGLLNLVSKISLFAGILILLLFSIWLKIELYQDKKLNMYFEKNKCKKLSIEGGIYECQACGNRKVYPSDKRCNSCGVKFILDD